MEVYRKSSWFFLLLGISFLATALQGVQGEVELEGPSESECRPYIERALKELETGDVNEATSSQQSDTSLEENLDVTNDNSNHQENGDGEQNDTNEKETGSIENIQIDTTQDEQSFEQIRETQEQQSEEQNDELTDTTDKQEEEITQESIETEETTENVASHESIVKENEGSIEDQPATTEETESVASAEQTIEGIPESTEESPIDKQENTEDSTSAEHLTTKPEDSQEQTNVEEDKTTTTEESEEQTTPTASVEDSATSGEEQPTKEEQGSSEEQSTRENVEEVTSNEEHSTKEVSTEEEQPTKENVEEQSAKEASSEEEQPTKENAGDTASSENQSTIENVSNEEGQIIKENLDEEPLSEEQPTKETSIEIASEEEQPAKENVEEASSETPSSEEQQIKGSLEDVSSDASTQTEQSDETKEENAESKETTDAESETTVIEEAVKNSEEGEEKVVEERAAEQEAKSVESVEESAEPVPEEDLTLEMEIPVDLRPRDHVEQLLKLDDDSKGTENIINKVSEITLKELKKLYENAIKPLEVLYKYRDLSNRHFGDAEIFSKPLILFMGPWSGGKSSIINYLTNNEYNETSLRTGAEPSPAYFNILMYGNEPEIIDGTELAADFTFSGLQKFGQGLEERLRGVRLPTKLLEKVNIVEIPGILEVRKQVSRVFPFNDACQWFIDRADIIFLVYDPSKLDVGPETEAILDQLKGREHQTRIILNKADQVKPEELMRVQGALIWNISPLMSSPQPPIMYTTSLWSRPYEFWAPTRLLQAQERAFLRDLRGAVDKRIENKIASARRFAVRVRNHAKMVDCYLTTYYNHKSVFGNRKQVADEIIEHPQDYHIYEGLSTLTNISRYDLPDPEVYKDFFKLNPLYDFQQLSATCTYFRGCPINRLDVAIAYDLPELVGTHRRLVENALAEANLASAPPGS